LEAQRAIAEGALADASDALAAQQTALAQLRRRRLDGFAGELASDLVAGEPCAVGGSTLHPAPAEHSDPASADDIERAENERDKAVKPERDARNRVGELKTAVATAAARADSRTVDAVEAEVAAAGASHAEAKQAVHQLAAAEKSLAEFAEQSAR